MGISPQPRPVETLAERFWSLARAAEQTASGSADEREPIAVVRRVLSILDAIDSDQPGADITRRTISFLALLRQHEAAGDLSYASPEQARGDRVDERSVVFSVGVLIFEQLTGRHPFGATDGPRRVARMQRGELGSGVQFFPQVPPALRAVLVRSMGPFPEERYASLGELREELERFAGVPAARPARSREPAPETARRLDLSDEPQEAAALPAPRAQPLDRIAAPSSAAPAAVDRARWVERMLFAGGGALLASAAILGLRLAGSAPAPVLPPTPPPIASAPVRTVAPRPSPAVTVLEPPPLVVPVPPPAAALPAAAFDPEAVGEVVASALHACFPERPLAAFGVGVLMQKGNPHARRVYLSTSEPLSPMERRCVVERVVGRNLGAAPSSSTVIELRLRLRATGSHEVRASIAPP